MNYNEDMDESWKRQLARQEMEKMDRALARERRKAERVVWMLVGLACVLMLAAVAVLWRMQ